MHRVRFLAAVGAILLAACISAGALTLHDSEGFVYATYGEGAYGSVAYFPIHVTGQSPSGIVLNGEGLLIYDPVYNAATIIVFESEAAYGWTLQGHWTANGCTFNGANNNGRQYYAQLYLDAGLAVQAKKPAAAGSNFK